MKKLLSLLILLSALGVASDGASAKVVKHTKKHVAHVRTVKTNTPATCYSGPMSSIYQSGDCSSCAVDQATYFDSTPLGSAYARLQGLSSTPAIVTPDLASSQITLLPIYVMPEHTVLLADNTPVYPVRKTTVGGFTVVSTDNPSYYSLFKHHYSEHNTKGVDKTADVGISPRAGSLPENYGTVQKEQ